ncbi:hypothetical protein BRC67_03865 [Halobacteriales archaeon QH_3_68_24]|nr:MAG: hypothetical protein BRC67_03865 [Halobacteriales archaeon QH_3_68_24]
MILPAVSLSRISPPRGGGYLYEVTAGSMKPRLCSSAFFRGSLRTCLWPCSSSARRLSRIIPALRRSVTLRFAGVAGIVMVV